MPYAIYGLLAIALALITGYVMSPPIKHSETSRHEPRVLTAGAAPTESAAPQYPVLRGGQALEWSGDKADATTDRQAGPYLVHIVKMANADGVTPVVTVTQGADSVTMTGETVSESYTHRISLVPASPGSPAMIMLQSFTGGAHCCNHVQIAADLGGGLRVVDLGAWDGEEISPPNDVDGDGRADFVMSDESFLYSFAPYAMSVAPPKVIDIIDGRVVDVSTRPQFRRVYLKPMKEAGQTCRTDADGTNRNGACAAYVADAARAGHLTQAWSDMLRSFAPTEAWDYPSGCQIKAKGECPEALKIAYKTYPEALLAFLKSHGYVAQRWTPPDAVPANIDGLNAADPQA